MSKTSMATGIIGGAAKLNFGIAIQVLTGKAVRGGVAVAVVAAALAMQAAPASAQQKEYCVTKLPFPPVPPATQSKLVVYQAYAVPAVGLSNTVFSYHAQLQNQSSGTITVSVTPANLSAAPGTWKAPSSTFKLTSYQPTDVVIATLTVAGKTNTNPVDPWKVVDDLIRQCPFSK